MRKNVWIIVLTYAVVAGLWIFFSDRLLGTFVVAPEKLVEWSTVKGLLFVVVTAGMLYVLISRLTVQLYRALDAWKTSERKFRTLFEEVTDGIVVVNLATKQFHLVNHSFCQMLGYSEAELRQLAVPDIHPPEAIPYVMENFAKQAHGVITLVRDVPVKRADGSVFHADINATVVELEDEPFVIGVFRDITEHKRVESDLKQAKEAAETANRAKDQFIAVLSHELRTPLTPALATITAMQEQGDLPDGVRADLEVARRNLELEARLIDDLLDVTRISRGKVELHFERADAHEVLTGALEICRGEIQSKDLVITIRFEAKHPYVWADPPRLQQVFWNLVSNAVKFTPAGGKISLRSANVGDRLRIEIADTGVGIRADDMPRLFRAFEQGEQTRIRRFGGLGLGLSLAKSLVELHEGALTATSEGKDRGTTFAVELGTVEADSKASLSVSAPIVLPEHPWRILLVDDHADTLRILGRLLKKWNYTVETADSVQSALELAAKQKFDLLLSDLGLPDGSGLEIMKEVKARYGLRGIALSGFGAEEDIKASREAGFEEHFVKPVSFPALQNALQRICVE